ncbi:MAG: hypothetical protein WDM87_08600 [Terracidiphilus sp.]
MWRAILLFMLGILCAALFVAAVSVYAFHDVDKEQIGHWNEAFAALCIEGVIFTLIVGGGVALLALLGRYVFHLAGYYPRLKLVFFLGVAVTLLQYLWDFVSRVALPQLADASLSAFLVIAIVLCSTVFVRDAFRQMKLSQGGKDRVRVDLT